MASGAGVTVIGRTTRVRGRVTGSADVQVLGLVDGEIAVDGDVTVDTHGMVGAGVQGRKVVVRGAVKGDLTGSEAVLLEEGARVVGDIRAPRIAIGPGALVRGYVDTGAGGGAPARATRGQAAMRPTSASTSTARAPGPKPVTVATARASDAAATQAGNHAPARRPPPPVVPALKKAKGQVAKRKER